MFFPDIKGIMKLYKLSFEAALSTTPQADLWNQPKIVTTWKPKIVTPTPPPSQSTIDIGSSFSKSLPSDNPFSTLSTDPESS
jgi:hypothetical protein